MNKWNHCLRSIETVFCITETNPCKSFKFLNVYTIMLICIRTKDDSIQVNAPCFILECYLTIEYFLPIYSYLVECIPVYNVSLFSLLTVYFSNFIFNVIIQIKKEDSIRFIGDDWRDFWVTPRCRCSTWSLTLLK